LRAIPLERWRLAVVVPERHKLLEIPKISLEALAEIPLACYERTSAARRAVDDAFASAGL
jgi:LysR family cys regulon transcriptional activator